MALYAEATYNPDLVMRALLEERPAEIRFATDLVAPIHWFFEQVTRTEPSEPVRTSNATPSSEYAPTPDTWLFSTLNVIDEFRTLADRNSPDMGPIFDRLTTAEHLATYLAAMPSERRPQLMIDTDGRPSFASSIADFYLNLSVDEPGLVTWYATLGAEEFFAEAVSFNGRQLPEGLKTILTA